MRYCQTHNINILRSSKIEEIAFYVLHCCNYNMKLALEIVTNNHLRGIRTHIKNYQIKSIAAKLRLSKVGDRASKEILHDVENN